VSIIISALTAGYASASISFDFDVNPMKRRNEPNFYGYVPDQPWRRTLCFLCLMFNSALLLLLRSFGAALLIMASTRYFVAYFVGDLAFYLLQKGLRNDLWYWTPSHRIGGMLSSFLTRIAAKVVTDYTGLLQMRGSGELGKRGETAE